MSAVKAAEARELSRLRGLVGAAVTAVANENEPDQLVELLATRQLLVELSTTAGPDGKPEDLAMLAAIAVVLLAERKRTDGYARPAS